jgi:hypothetical protein
VRDRTHGSPLWVCRPRSFKPSFSASSAWPDQLGEAIGKTQSAASRTILFKCGMVSSALWRRCFWVIHQRLKFSFQTRL